MIRAKVLSILFLLISSSGLSIHNKSISFNNSEKEIASVPSNPYQEFLPFIKNETGFFVAPNGSDANPGTIQKPWKTIGKAAQMVGPGDTVYIRGGTYVESIDFHNSGTESNPIRIIAYSGENPIIDGGFNGGLGSLVNLLGDYIDISGIEVRNSGGWGIYVYGNYDIVDKVYVHHCMMDGIIVSHGRNSIVQNSRVWRNSLNNEYGLSSKWATGLEVSRYGVSDVTIRNNLVWENWGEGITSYGADHVTIEGNISHDNFAINIYISDSTNVLCQRNFVYMDPASYVFGIGSNAGIELGDELYVPPSANITIINNIAYANFINFGWWQGVQGGGMNNVLIANNTFVNSRPNSNGGRNVDIGAGPHQNVRIMNNIIVQEDSQPIEDITINPQVVLSNNLWSKPPKTAILGTQSMVGDPLLLRTGTPFDYPWFELTSGSPAIDHALKLPEIMYDYLLNTRGALPDIGAFEFIQ